jgi:hypothetical protein
MRRNKAVAQLFVAALCSALVISAVPVAADSPAEPSYNGQMNFPTIADPSAPEDYAWEAQLGFDQTLEQIDDQHARVVYGDGTQAFAIVAESAHDAVGVRVPTTLAVSDGKILTLTVHHRVGNPAADGVPFRYPVTPGAPFEVGYSPGVVVMPPAEAQGSPDQPASVAPVCVVPRLRPHRCKPRRPACGARTASSAAFPNAGGRLPRAAGSWSNIRVRARSSRTRCLST